MTPVDHIYSSDDMMLYCSCDKRQPVLPQLRPSPEVKAVYRPLRCATSGLRELLPACAEMPEGGVEIPTYSYIIEFSIVHNSHPSASLTVYSYQSAAVSSYVIHCVRYFVALAQESQKAEL